MVNSWSPASVPASRDNKPGWYKLHNKHAKDAFNTRSDTLLIGDSIVSGLSRYKSVWNKFFGGVLNQGIGGDMTQNVLWRLRNTRLSHYIKFVVIHCGTNNIDFNQPEDIASALIAMAEKIHLYRPDVKVILSGILPRDSGTASIRCVKILKTNNHLLEKCHNLRNIFYLEHDIDWNHNNGSLNDQYYHHDNLHLIKLGNEKIANEITNLIKNIRNNDGFVGNNPYVIPPSCSSYTPHSSTHTSHIGKIDFVKKPKYEECEYIHTSSVPQSFSSLPPPPPRQQRRRQQRRQRRQPQPQPQSFFSSSPSSSIPSSPLSALPILFLSILLSLKIYFNNFLNCIYRSVITFLTFIFHKIYLIFHFTFFVPCLICIYYCLYCIYFSANLLKICLYFISNLLIFIFYAFFYLIYKFLTYAIILIIFIYLSNTLYKSSKPIYNENYFSTIYINESYEGNFLVNNFFNVFSIYKLTEINNFDQIFCKQILLFSIKSNLNQHTKKQR